MTQALSENPHAGQGSVLLDIGDDVGALIVTMPEETVGLEVEIRPVVPEGSHHSHTHSHGHEHADGHHGHDHSHDHDHLVHVAVVPRPVAHATVPSLVYPELVTGAYDVFEKGHPEAVVLTVEVEGGRVTLAAWPV